MSLTVPAHLKTLVVQMSHDFAFVTGRWVEEGWHKEGEVAEWRATIRADMAEEVSVNPAIDGRPREERIRAWCRTWARFAEQMRKERGK